MGISLVVVVANGQSIITVEEQDPSFALDGQVAYIADGNLAGAYVATNGQPQWTCELNPVKMDYGIAMNVNVNVSHRTVSISLVIVLYPRITVVVIHRLDVPRDMPHLVGNVHGIPI